MLPISQALAGVSRNLAIADVAPAGLGTGVAAIAMAVVFNLPFATLAKIYEYPQILRRPAGEALDAFAAGGPLLILTWYGFALTALALVPLAIGLSISTGRLARHPGLSLGAAIVGALAGLTQAIGLMRWVFVVPALAAAHADPAASPAVTASTEAAFALLNSYGGVAIGEHLGQLLTATFVVMMAMLQWRETARIASSIGALTALLVIFGTGEGLALALGQSGDLFSLATIAGFLALTAWFIATGTGLFRNALRRQQV